MNFRLILRRPSGEFSGVKLKTSPAARGVVLFYPNLFRLFAFNGVLMWHISTEVAKNSPAALTHVEVTVAYRFFLKQNIAYKLP